LNSLHPCTDTVTNALKRKTWLKVSAVFRRSPHDACCLLPFGNKHAVGVLKIGGAAAPF
jgi:hypothetical protein